MDADGQHLAEDVGNMVRSAEKLPEKLVLGVRDLKTGVPLRSSFGNMVMRKVLNRVAGLSVHDTQTGLRAYPVDFALECREINSDRYEFEMRSLLLAVKTGIEIVQVPITTLYEEGNKSSHFRPLIDSMRVMAVFLRFLAVSTCSFVVDIAAFFVLYSLSTDIISSTYIARCLSAAFNFTANKLFVFKSTGRKRTIYEVAGYVALAVGIASLSALLVSNLSGDGTGNVVAVKVIVDSLLFVLSFLAQRHGLFVHRPEPQGSPDKLVKGTGSKP